VAEAQASSDTPPRPMQALPRDVPPVAAPAAAAGAPVPQVQPGAPDAQVVPVGGLPGGPLPPGVVRASDTDRAETVGALRDEFAAGRLSHDTFLYRMHAAMEARHVTDLPPLLADLPPAEQPAPGVLGRIKGTWSRLTSRPGGSGPRGARPQPAPGDAAPHGIAAASGEPGRRLTSAIRLPEGPAPHKSVAQPVPLPFPRTDEGFFTIGRDSRCDLAIDHMTVSRIHARLERTPEGWVLKDLSSTNGTRVNGWRVRGQVTVRAGDVIRFGDVEYTLTPDQRLPLGTPERSAAGARPRRGVAARASRATRLLRRDYRSARPAWADRLDGATADGLDAGHHPR
jgi:hypothetical protein